MFLEYFWKIFLLLCTIVNSHLIIMVDCKMSMEKSIKLLICPRTCISSEVFVRRYGSKLFDESV